MTFLIMMNKDGKTLIHHLGDECYKRDLVYEMLSRYYDLGFMWVDFLVITKH